MLDIIIKIFYILYVFYMVTSIFLYMFMIIRKRCIHIILELCFYFLFVKFLNYFFLYELEVFIFFSKTLDLLSTQTSEVYAYRHNKFSLGSGSPQFLIWEHEDIINAILNIIWKVKKDEVCLGPMKN